MASQNQPKLTSKCPICKKPSVFDFRPFCSKKCSDVDLAHWLRGDYRIPGEDVKIKAGEEEFEDS